MGKIDPVAQNRIQTEFIQKELKATRLRTDFTLNVRRMQNELVSEKVTMSPRYDRGGISDAGSVSARGAASSSRMQDVGRSIAGAPGSTSMTTPAGEQIMSPETLTEISEAQMMEDLVEQIMKPKRTPRQVYAEPITSSMKIGWDLDQMKEFRSGNQGTKWRRPKVSTELSNYCKRYCKMYGFSPYAQSANT